MRIKEAAKHCNLTEKAIRVYEERGLISPTVTEKNGRKFRDYDDETVARLQTIATLRRAFFSLDQIAAMFAHPESVEAVFDDYRAELERRYASLTPLRDRAASLELSDLATAETLSDAMTKPRADENDHVADVPSLHFRVWNEEMGRDEREAAYARCQKYLKKWGRFYGVTLFFDECFAFLSRHRRRILKTALIVGAAAWLLYNIPFPVYVHETVTGYELRFTEETDDAVTDLWLSMTSAELEVFDTSSMPAPDTITEREISLNGWALYYLFRDDVFDGYLDIEGYTMREPPLHDDAFYPDLIEQYGAYDDRRRVQFKIARGTDMWDGFNPITSPKEGNAPYVNDDYTSAIQYITLTKNRMSSSIGLPFSATYYYPHNGKITFHKPWGDDMILFSLDDSVRSTEDATRVFWEEFWKPRYTAIQRNKERSRELIKEKYGIE